MFYNCSIKTCSICVYINMKKAFTLSEVLIALTIIGVVAAITVPTLFANYTEEEKNQK